MENGRRKLRTTYSLKRRHHNPPIWRTWEKLSQREGQRRTVYELNGDRYLGEWHNDKRHGKGTCWYSKSGNIYSGYWDSGQRSGHGTLAVPYPSRQDHWRIYVGEWKYDKFHGFGTGYFTNGDIYEGEWRHGRMNGCGKMIYSNGSSYEGEWANGRRTGMGIFDDEKGNRYEGSWKDDKKSGAGKFIMKEKGTVFEGCWMDNHLRCGFIEKKESKDFNNYLPLPELELVDPQNVLKNAKQDVKRRYGSETENDLTTLQQLEETVEEESLVNYGAEEHDSLKGVEECKQYEEEVVEECKQYEIYGAEEDDSLKTVEGSLILFEEEFKDV